jgi:ABC-type polysaccharide/polyol phosphate transport system ATPase subunit
MGIIEVQGVSKRFYLPQREGKGHLWEFVPTLLQRRKAPEFWVLKDVSFSVEPGETVAIMGPNGSGKSTLLKIVAGVFHPTQGRVQVRGKVCPLIELGAGFHRDLAGRDNVFLSGVVLGMTKRQVHQAFDAIVEFAELRDFMEVPLKRLSSGMQMRLAFSVAVHAQPEILIVDEVLAVGDASFQRKCFDWLIHFQRQGGTILFVSHDPTLVYKLSDRVLHLYGGEIKEEEQVSQRLHTSAVPVKPREGIE